MAKILKSLGSILILLLGALSFGTISSYPSPAIMNLTQENPKLLEKRFSNLITWFSNGPRLSAALGPFIIICVLPKYGRKICLSIVSFLLGISWFLLLLINLKDKINDVQFNLINGIIARTVMGLFLGIMSSLTITYIIDLSPQDSIGLFGSLYQLFIILGICLNNILDAFVDWEILLTIGAFIDFILAIGLLFHHDSTVSIKLKNMKKYCMLCDHKTLQLGIKENLANNVLSSMAMLFFQQYCGINAILNNLSSIMILSGLDINPNLQSALATLAQFLACLIACFLVDYIGVKILRIVSSIGCLLSLVLYDYCIYNTQNLMNVPGYIPVLSVFVYCLFFGLGQGPCPWAFFPGSFPDHLRYEGVCMMMFSHWLFSFIVCYTHPIITEKIGEFYAVLIYIICSVGSLLYGFFWLPQKESNFKIDSAMF